MIWRCQKNKSEELWARKFPAQDAFRAILNWKFRLTAESKYMRHLPFSVTVTLK
jgi:hypothetical protein